MTILFRAFKLSLSFLLVSLGSALHAQTDYSYINIFQKLLCEQNAPGFPIIATADGRAEPMKRNEVLVFGTSGRDDATWLMMRQVIKGVTSVSFMSTYGKWMSVKPDGSVVANSDASSAEKFQLAYSIGGGVNLKSPARGNLTFAWAGDPPRGLATCMMPLKKPPTVEQQVFFLSKVPLLTARADIVMHRKCGENEVCTQNFVPGSVVAYGADTRWNTKVISGPFKCDNASFSDPAPGATKECRSALLTDLRYCASDNQVCVLPVGGMFAVVYGSGARWTVKTASMLGGAVSCNSASFGGDPSPGIAKTCGVAVITMDQPKRPMPPTGRFSQAQLDSVIAWMVKEYNVYETPVCWKQSYDRGIGIAPQGCTGGKSLENTLCYDNCRSG
jgi:hypothetical protein